MRLMLNSCLYLTHSLTDRVKLQAKHDLVLGIAGIRARREC